MSTARARGVSKTAPLLAGLLLFVGALLSLLWNVLILSESGVFPFGLTEIGAALGFVGGLLCIARVKYTVTMAFCGVADLFFVLRAALRFDATYSLVLWIAFLLGLVGLVLIERNKGQFA